MCYTSTVCAYKSSITKQYQPYVQVRSSKRLAEDPHLLLPFTDYPPLPGLEEDDGAAEEEWRRVVSLSIITLTHRPPLGATPLPFPVQGVREAGTGASPGKRGGVWTQTGGQKIFILP